MLVLEIKEVEPNMVFDCNHLASISTFIVKLIYFEMQAKLLKYTLHLDNVSVLFLTEYNIAIPLWSIMHRSITKLEAKKFNE
jgi:hypothetical protein